jgi:hypothetical protein
VQVVKYRFKQHEDLGRIVHGEAVELIGQRAQRGDRGSTAGSDGGKGIGGFLRTLALPREVEVWSLTTLREKVVKIGAKVIAHGRYLVFQMAEVAVPRELFRRLLDRIAGLRPAVVARC